MRKFLTVLQSLLVGMSLSVVLAPARVSAQNPDYCGFGTRSTLFLVDQTTVYDKYDEEVFIEGLSQFDKSIMVGERLVIATINDAAPESQMLFDQCKPGCPELSTFEEMFASCKRIIARRDGIRFRAEFVATLRDMLKDKHEYKQSAIIETIKARSEEIITSPTDRIVIFSDLLENSLAYPWPTIVREVPGQILTRIAADGVIPGLDGVEVIAFGLGRNHDPDRTPLRPSDLENLRNFWNAYFIMGGAARSDVGIAYKSDMR